MIETARDVPNSLVRIVVADDGPGIPAGRARQAVPAVLLDEGPRQRPRPGDRAPHRRRARRQHRRHRQHAARHRLSSSYRDGCGISRRFSAASIAVPRHRDLCLDSGCRRRAWRPLVAQRRAEGRRLRRRRRRRPAKSVSSRPTARAYDVIVLDVWLPGHGRPATLQRLRERQIDSQVVIISGHGNIESAVRAIKMGAFDFVEKPLSLEKTVLVVRNALRQRDLEAENRVLRAQGRSPAAARWWARARDEAAARAGRAWPRRPTAAC